MFLAYHSCHINYTQSFVGFDWSENLKIFLIVVGASRFFSRKGVIFFRGGQLAQG
jgi:hypothetical protein